MSSSSSTPQSRRRSRASSRPETTSFQTLPASTPPLALNILAVSTEPSDFVRRKDRPARIPVDIRFLEYVSSCDSNLVCLICHCPFDKPVRLICDHIFCADCLEHAFASQQEHAQKACPTCRCRVDLNKEPLPAPRVLSTMLDELHVKCPNAKAGCTWENQRCDVHDHVDLYCEYAQVECASNDCRLGISQKDFHKGCLHYTVSCEHCHTSMMKKDLEEHQKSACPKRMTECPNCSIEIPRVNLKIHIKDVCPKATIPCPGSILGCIHVSERVVVVEHAKTCPMATIAPHFQSQKARLDEFEKQNKVLERKVEVLEGGFANINNMLWPSNPSDGSSFPVSDPLDPNAVDTSTPAQLPGTPDFRLPPPSFPPPQQTEQAPTSGYPPPFDSSTHHLLSLHESLREEVTRIANALTEVEGRTTMMIINENQRAKEEMLHTNAAINAMRMQLHWLTSARLQQSQNRPTSSAGSSAAGRSGGSNNGSGNGNGGSGSGASSLGTPHPLRRMSDLNRQDTKL